MQGRKLRILAISCVLACAGHAQTPGPGKGPKAQPQGAQTQAPPAPGGAKASGSEASPGSVGMDQSVITLEGGCTTVGDITPAKDCISTVTRAQFEKLINALQPEMSADARRTFASNYGKILVYADAAKALHLENDPNVQALMQFVSQQVLAEGIRRHYFEQFAHPSDQQIQDYYNQNRAKYLEMTLQRIIVPRASGTAEKPKPSEADEKSAAEKLRQRWIAGEDPVKLEQEAFEAAGIKGPTFPDVNFGTKRPGSLPINQESVFQMKAGEVSELYTDPGTMFIYKVVSVRAIPLAEVRDSIIKILEQQQLQDKLQEIGKSATPVLNEEYFGSSPTAGPAPTGSGPVPGSAAQPGNPPK